MDDLSIALLDRLIEKTFENMEQEERLAFVERLFADMSPESQERFLGRMLRRLSREEAGSAEPELPTGPGWSGPPFMRRAMEGRWPRDIGPWRICWRMMADIDRASRVDTLDTARPARVFSALADETRLKIVKLLMESEMRVDDLTRTLNMPQSTVSHHLRVLKEAGLVQAEKRGRSIYYSLTHPLDES